MTDTSRTVLKQDILNLINPLFYPKLGRLVMPLAASGGGTTTAIIDLLARGSGDVDDYNGVQLENITNSESMGVTDAGFATATLTFTPTSTTVANNDVILAYPPTVSPEQCDEGIDRILLNTEALFAYAPTMINADAADFTGTVTAEWIDVSGPTVTQTYDTADDFVLTGERSLKVTTSGATDGGVTSRNIAVTEGETMTLSVFIACPTGSLVVQAYDVSNSAVISTSGAYNDPDFNEIRLNSIVAPDNCELMSVRLINKTATSTFYMAQNPTLQSQMGRIYRLPSWLEHEGMVVRVVQLPVRDAGEVADSYLAHAAQYVPGPRVEYITSERSITALSVKFRIHSRPVAFVVFRGFEALATNAATTTCDRQYLTHKVAARLCKLQNDDNWITFARIAHRRAVQKGYGEKSTTFRENANVPLQSRNQFSRLRY